MPLLNLFARGRGVEILLENIPNGLSSAEKLLMFEELTYVGMNYVFDTGHVNIGAGVEHEFELMKERIRSTYVHDNNGKDDLVLSFAGYGLYAWMNNATWRLLHAFEAARLTVGDLDGGGLDELIADFPGYGLWVFRNNTTWNFLHSLSVTTMTTVDLDNNGKADLVASFATYGIYIFSNNTSWTFLHPYAAKVIAAGRLDPGTQADLVIDFGATYGIYTYRNSAAWVPLHYLTSTGLTVADYDGDGRDEVAIGFGASGVWRYSAIAASPWTYVNAAPVTALVSGRIH